MGLMTTIPISFSGVAIWEQVELQLSAGMIRTMLEPKEPDHGA